MDATSAAMAEYDAHGIAEVDIDLRAGFWNGTKTEGRGFVYAPPTVARGGGAYTLLPGPRIHEAPFMPDALARVLGAGSRRTARAIVDGGCPCAGGESAKAAAAQEQVPFTRAAARSNYSAEGSETEATDDAAEGGFAPATAAAAGAKPPSAPRPLTPAQEVAFKREALRAVVARAGTDRVGYPDIVELIANVEPVFGCPAVRIKFRLARGTLRVCPLTRIEHENSNLFVGLGVDKNGASSTGLPAFFVYCFSEKCNQGHKLEMLALVDTASYAELGIVCTGVSHKSVGQTVVLLGATAAKDMPGSLVSASTMTDAEQEHATREAAHEGQHEGRGQARAREQELMVIRATIVAHTEAALEANVPLAAESLLKALDTLVYVCADGTQNGYTDVEYGGEFVFYVWHRVARFSFTDRGPLEKRHEFLLFNGSTFEAGHKDEFVHDAFVHLKHIAEALRKAPSLRIRAEKLVRIIAVAGDYFTKLIHHALACMKNQKMLARCGHLGTSEFHTALCISDNKSDR
jgi:hypothetical protein